MHNFLALSNTIYVLWSVSNCEVTACGTVAVALNILDTTRHLDLDTHLEQRLDSENVRLG